jgi:hypothetical protein
MGSLPLRCLATSSILALGILLLPADAAGPEEAAPRPAFVLGNAYAEALNEAATGVYVLGTTRIRTWTAVHYLLVRNGRGVQIQTKAGGAWLPKLAGSEGGHTVGADRFDELLAIAGGVNRDVRDLPAAQRDRFSCIAGFGGCVGRTTELGRSVRTVRSLAGETAVGSRTGFFGLSTATAATVNRQVYFANGAPGPEFRLEFDARERGLWFLGLGMRAGWRVPPLDEI